MTRIERLELTGRLFVWAMALSIICVVGLVFRDLYTRILRPPPFQFSAQEYQPEQLTLCPGQTLAWRSSLIVRRTPSVLLSTQVVWSVALNRAWKPGTGFNTYVWTDSEEGKPLSRRATFTLPPDIPPGAYQVRVGASGLNTDPDAYRVPFNVPTTCKGRAP